MLKSSSVSSSGLPLEDFLALSRLLTGVEVLTSKRAASTWTCWQAQRSTSRCDRSSTDFDVWARMAPWPR